MINWNSITVGQFQDIHKLSLSTMDEFDKIEMLISIIFNKTDEQVGNMTRGQFNDHAKQCAFLLTDEVPGKPVRFINIGVKKYGIIYNPARLRHRQYVEILSYADSPIENMHKIMASLVQRIRFGFWRMNKVENHSVVAKDMLRARVVDVYHSAVFFCKLYINSIRVIRPYLEAELMEKGATEEQAQILVTSSINVMAGFIQQEKWQQMNVSA